MNSTPVDPLALRRAISDLADGEVDADAAFAGCRRWVEDPAAREAWHTYHLIGDVLRSEDLAHPPARDRRFLDALHDRLDREPVVLAPMPPVRPPRPLLRFRWLAPAAVAAGFAVVGGMLVLTRDAAPGAETALPRLAGAAPAVGGQVLSAAATSPPAAAMPAATAYAAQDLRMIRDARLDQYLRAHRDGLGAAPVAVPGGALRSVETIVPQRR